MKIFQKILLFLIENKEKTFSIYELSKVLNIDYKLTYTHIKKLQNEGSIFVEDFKNQKRCSFRDHFTPDVFIVEYERRASLLKKKEFWGIYEYLRSLPILFILASFFKRKIIAAKLDKPKSKVRCFLYGSNP